MVYIVRAEYIDYTPLYLIRGNRFEYVTLFRKNERFFMAEKGRYSCCQPLTMTRTDAEPWLSLFDLVKLKVLTQ